MKRNAINLSGGELSPDSLVLKKEIEDQLSAIFGKPVSASWFVPPEGFETKNSHEIIEVDIEE